MENNDAKLSTENLCIQFGSKVVIKNIYIYFPEKNITALIGPSGCGKTTLLRSFNRMHDLVPEAKVTGRVLMDGINLYDSSLPVTSVRRRIGMVFQKPNPFPASIYDNVAYGLKINGVHKTDIAGMVEQSLKESFLWQEVKDDLKKPAQRLSGGQQQRLCIARAIAIKPEVILMDEPCSALDPISTAKVEELMLELKKHYTILTVTHSMAQAQRVADKVAFMYMGDLIEHGDKTQIFQSPKENLTYRYISGNFG
jgi:phosphate transport system ATP-binding protein